jgi:hypothetical protein
MPHIVFDERPAKIPVLVESWDKDPTTSFEFKILENIVDPKTGEKYDPPLVLPEKKSTEWVPGDKGQLLYMGKDKSDPDLYYKFTVVSKPIIGAATNVLH